MRTDRTHDPVRRADAAHPGTVTTVRHALIAFHRHGLLDWAAALTYYSVLSIFPGLVVLVSLLGVAGQATTDTVIDEITRFAPGPVGDTLIDGIGELRESPTTASFFAIAGLVAALWSASGYVGAFMRASNTLYGVPEGRPLWWVWPVRLGITVITGALVIVCAFLIVFTGGMARWLGRFVGADGVFITVWEAGKWPVLVILMSLILAILYWAAPNVRIGFRPVGLGSVIAVVLWVAVSAGFAGYVANFASYDRTYGTLGGVIVFLVWLWISNIAVLFGAELDSRMRRRHADDAGAAALRSGRTLSKENRRDDPA